MRSTFSLAVFASVLVVSVLSGCHEERKKALKSDSRARIVPKCTKDGDYQDLQCVSGTANCTCYRADGSQIADPSPKVRTCECISHKDKVSGKRLIGGYKPQCEDDGSYKRTQCHGGIGSCWCVDEHGKKNGKPIDQC